MKALKQFPVKTISPGRMVSGIAVVIQERLSLKGTVDPKSGIIRKPGTPLDGVSIAGKVLLFISGKGSSSWSGYFKIACRHGNSPVAIVNVEVDPLVASACVFNDIPLVQVKDPSVLDKVKSGDLVTVDSERGLVLIHQKC